MTYGPILTVPLSINTAFAAATANKPSFSLDLQNSAISENAKGSPTPTFTRATTKYVLGYAADAEVTDDPLLIQCASGEIGFTGARRISEGVWSSYDANGVFLSTTNGASALCCDASGPFGYLPEGARTNLMTQSEDLSNATAWTKTFATVTANATTAPNGTATADLLLETAEPGVHLAYSNAEPITEAGTYTFSAHAKYRDRTWISLAFNDYGTSGLGLKEAYFNVQTGAIGTTSSGVTARLVETLPNGWFRFSVTLAVASVDCNVQCRLASADGTASYAGDITKGNYWWGMQVEAGAFPTSYIPTTTAAAPRNADIDAYATAGNLNGAAMTIALDFIPEADAMGTVYLFGSYVDANNGTAILHDGTNMIARKRIGGTDYDATIALDYDANTVYRVVARFDAANGVDVWVDGTKGTGDTEDAACQLGATFQVGAYNSLQQACGSVRRFSAYPQGLSDAQAAAL